MSQIRMETAEEALGHADYKKALTSLLYQLADDNFLVGYRGSEWLGLAPHLEADVAFCSIAQDHMGHAALYYQLLEALGEGKADDLAHLRNGEDFRNAILVERPNGEGDYIVNPQYDWAYAVIRQYIFDLFEQVRTTALTQSTYLPLAQVAAKVSREKHYHLMHGESWLQQMATTTTEAKEKLTQALQRVWEDVEELFDLGEHEEDIVSFGLIASKQDLRQAFLEKLNQRLEQYHMPSLGEMKRPEEQGRFGKHSVDLEDALNNISEVYRQDPAANW